MQKPTKSVHEVSVEEWYPRGDRNQTGRVKIAVRVRKGAVGANRPGTFHGATNFPTKRNA